MTNQYLKTISWKIEGKNQNKMHAAVGILSNPETGQMVCGALPGSIFKLTEGQLENVPAGYYEATDDHNLVPVAADRFANATLNKIFTAKHLPYLQSIIPTVIADRRAGYLQVKFADQDEQLAFISLNPEAPDKTTKLRWITAHGLGSLPADSPDDQIRLLIEFEGGPSTSDKGKSFDFTTVILSQEDNLHWA